MDDKGVDLLLQNLIKHLRSSTWVTGSEPSQKIFTFSDETRVFIINFTEFDKLHVVSTPAVSAGPAGNICPTCNGIGVV